MNPQPTIFISSIISEFYDLRGALKYFLGKNGFRVLMSEEPDFGVNCNQDSLPTCKMQIEKSDYYLLIVGNEPGTIFDDNGKETTVTIEEFRHFLKIRKNGLNLNFIVFVRKQTRENYKNNDTTKLGQLQIDFINEILNNTEDKILGRWRYSFDKFSEIIQVLETNQNGLFIDTTRKQSLYKIYLRKEFLEIYRMFFSKDEKTLKCITDTIDLPEIKFQGNIIDQQSIDRKVAGMIIALIAFFQNKNNLIQKIQRIFIYIAQGEFSYFDHEKESYVQPEYIKLSIQTGEILEKLVQTFTNIDIFNTLKTRYMGGETNYTISKAEYNMFVKPAFSDIKIVIAKLTNLVTFFENGIADLEKKDDDFYVYRGVVNDSIKNNELIDYAMNYFKKNKLRN
ncbi:MAG TPA: hypothetical protein DDX39_03800 [Bacteroidales bacterium]|nr:MAG: hypothetical protein A2W98_08960 [Bacteroidetes bacterium GWF2_33_38]OFY72745.1 MAG: hypothetical protein A2265_01760 [Bacteroidetes bacterium RIFOXYA12_FULL_33_9]OFY90125.1 MAG: hypothetical protein A2236_10120 [Bacteroidetes bacterium RIFOXYA2_FULL_33_7]HBF87745.1 hypothetical protein [Bacteroidales bacterium]